MPRPISFRALAKVLFFPASKSLKGQTTLTYATRI